jgi:hypothetical protein
MSLLTSAATLMGAFQIFVYLSHGVAIDSSPWRKPWEPNVENR